MTDAQIRQLSQEYIRETLAESDKSRLETGPQLIRDYESGEVVDTATPYSHLAEEAYKILEGQESRGIDKIMASFMETKGLKLDVSSLEYRKLRREIALAHLEVLKIDQERDLGNFSDPYHLPEEAGEKPALAPPSRSEPSRLLSEAISKYIEDARRSGDCSETSAAEYEGICSRFTWIFGDKDIRAITRDDVRAFRDTLPKLPAHLNKKAEYKGKSLPELLKMDIPRTIGTTQVNKYVRLLKAVFKWAEAEAWITDNPTKILKVAKKEKREDEERKAYSKEDLQRVIAGLAQEGQRGKLDGRPERFWVPLIGMFSGMRANEICQLQVKDVAQEDGTWHFIVNAEDGKRVKTRAGNRLIPIHSSLVGLGLLEYVEAMRRKGSVQLWENLQATSRGHRRSFSNWFNGQTNVVGFNRAYISQDKDKTFHSFRHSFRNELKQKLIDDRIADEIIGHKHGSIGLDRYGKPYSLKHKLEAVEQVDYGLDFRPIKSIPESLTSTS